MALRVRVEEVAESMDNQFQDFHCTWAAAIHYRALASCKVNMEIVDELGRPCKGCGMALSFVNVGPAHVLLIRLNTSSILQPDSFAFSLNLRNFDGDNSFCSLITPGAIGHFCSFSLDWNSRRFRTLCLCSSSGKELLKDSRLLISVPCFGLSGSENFLRQNAIFRESPRRLDGDAR